MTFGTLISLKPSFTICKLELIISILLTLVLGLKYLRPWAPMAVESCGSGSYFMELTMHTAQESEKFPEDPWGGWTYWLATASWHIGRVSGSPPPSVSCRMATASLVISHRKLLSFTPIGNTHVMKVLENTFSLGDWHTRKNFGKADLHVFPQICVLICCPCPYSAGHQIQPGGGERMKGNG